MQAQNYAFLSEKMIVTTIFQGRGKNQRGITSRSVCARFCKLHELSVGLQKGTTTKYEKKALSYGESR